MENATKALIIAAAVLVAIIIISLTLGVVRQGQETISSADMSQAEMDAYNAKFTMHEGTSISTAQVNTLLNTVLVHNQKEQEQKTYRYVYTYGDAYIEGRYSLGSTIYRATGSSLYTVKCEFNKGLVTSITIKKNP